MSSTLTIILIAIICLPHFVFPQAPSHDIHAPPPSNGSEAICLPYGICEPCPKAELQQPFCQPFGNRRLMHCTTTPPSVHPPAVAAAVPGQPHHGGQPHHNTNPHLPSLGHPVDHTGETPAWESCGRIVAQENADFWEFFACNVVFAIAALTLVIVRSRRLHALQTRQLAARIGLARGSARYG